MANPILCDQIMLLQQSANNYQAFVQNTGIYIAVLLCKFRFQFLDIQFDLTWVKSYFT